MPTYIHAYIHTYVHPSSHPSIQPLLHHPSLVWLHHQVDMVLLWMMKLTYSSALRMFFSVSFCSVKGERSSTQSSVSCFWFISNLYYWSRNSQCFIHVGHFDVDENIYRIAFWSVMSSKSVLRSNNLNLSHSQTTVNASSFVWQYCL